MLKEKIFNAVIKDYLKRGRPVGSKYLHKVYFPQLPSSTIRWYLRKLINDSLIVNVNKSYGRIPTDKGWRIYFENNLKTNKADVDNLYSQLKKKRAFENILDSFLKKFCLYALICYNNHYYNEWGLDYIIKNLEFNNKDYIIKLSNLIKKIKTKKDKLNLNNNKLNLLIGKELFILDNKIEDFSMFCWQQNKFQYFLISIKRTDYPLLYNLINKLFIKKF